MRPWMVMFGLFLAIAGVAVFWNADHVDGVTEAFTTDKPVAGAVPHAAWSGASPFAPLHCLFAVGEPVNSSACSPDAAKSPEALLLEDAPPLQRAQAALALIQAGEYDRSQMLAASISDCWFAETRLPGATPSPDQPVASTCDFAAVERIAETAEMHLKAAANKGDYIARGAFVDLILMKVMVLSNQMQFFDPNATDPNSVKAIRTLEAKVDTVRQQVVDFIEPMTDQSDSLRNALRINITLLENRK